MASVTAAKLLRARGLAIFPLAPGSKQPRAGSRGHLDASRDAEPETWEEGANTGVSPGASRPRRLIVDVDPRHGGNETAGRLREEGLLPPTLTVRTPSGGHHLYYVLPNDAEDVPSSAGRLGPGVDVRSSGGYVVGPGSTIDGASYRVVDRRAEERAPPALVEACGTRRDRDERAREFLVEPDQPQNVERARTFLRQTEPAIEGRGGNNHTYATAAVVRDFGISEELALELMLEPAWNDRCEPPWEKWELAGVVEHVYTYAKDPAGNRATHPGLGALIDGGDSGSSPPEERPNPFRPKLRREMRDHPPPYLIRGLIPQRSLVLVYGPEQSYKTFGTLSMARAIADKGVEEWAGLPVDTHGRVIYVCAEGETAAAKRLDALFGGRDLVPDTVATIDNAPLFADPEQWDLLVAALDEHAGGRPVRAIVVDTLASVSAGLEENSNADGQRLVDRARALIRRYAASVLYVAHSGQDETRGPRGNTAVPAGSDTRLRFRADLGAMVAEVHVEKQKDDERITDPIGLRMVSVHLGEHPRTGQPVTSLRADPDPSARVRPGGASQGEETDRALARELARLLPVGAPARNTTELVDAILNGRREGTEYAGEPIDKREIESESRTLRRRADASPAIGRYVRDRDARPWIWGPPADATHLHGAVQEESEE